MKSCYVDYETRAIADLYDTGSLSQRMKVITRINVPREHRGKGAARKLMAQLLADADASQTTLLLEVVPSGGLTYSQLLAWYTRCGFVLTAENRMKREPR